MGNKKPLAFFALILIAIVAVWTLISNDNKRRAEQTEAMYADNPVMLYRTVGIKDCEYDSRYKGELSGSVRLEGDDLRLAISFLEESVEKSLRGATTVLYINRPEVSERDRGQPALLPLKKQGDRYCALGVVGSYSVALFLELEKKYQAQIQ